MAIQSFADGVYQLRSGYVRAYIIDGDEGVTLVDTLLPSKEDAIAAVLNEIGRSFADVKTILLTHSHEDHAGSAAAAKAASEATLYASEADAPAIEGVVKPPNPPGPFYVKPLFLLGSLLPGAPPAEVDQFVSEAGGDRLPGDLRAIGTPGHTLGHTSYLLDRDGGVVFVGDAARATRDGRVVRGWFNRSTPAVDGSLEHLAEFKFEIAVFGHSGPLRAQASSAFRTFAEALT